MRRTHLNSRNRLRPLNIDIEDEGGEWVFECYAYISGIPYNAKEWRVLRRWEEPNSLQRCIRWAVADRVIMSNPEDYRIFNRVTKEAIPMAMFTELQNSGQYT